MIYEWDPKKARTNLRLHRVAFEEAATIFLDPFAVTYSDPDHSNAEDREITIGYSAKQRLLFVSHCRREIVSESSVPAGRRDGSGDNMKKVSPKKRPDGLRREYDLSQLKGGVRGKYYRQATSGTNLVLIKPDLTEFFPDGESVNRALRLLADTAGAAAGRSARRKPPNKAMQPTRAKVARG